MAEPKQENPFHTKTYRGSRPNPAERVNQYIHQWDAERLAQPKGDTGELPPTVCFSRKIGLGALDIADLVAQRLGCRVVDREILDYMAGEAGVNRRTVALFDERYPGKLGEFLALAFGEKAFVKTDYSRLLFSAVLSIAGLGTTLFVGRGCHLVLPRQRTLAVRFICARETRVRRLAETLEVPVRTIDSRLDAIDREQREFFKKVYGKKEASPYEFDLVINTDDLSRPSWAAEVVLTAFREKFPGSRAASGAV